MTAPWPGHGQPPWTDTPTYPSPGGVSLPPAGGVGYSSPPWGNGPNPAGGYAVPSTPRVVYFPGSGPVEVAEFWQRAVAKVLDFVILTVITAVPVLLGFLVLTTSGPDDTGGLSVVAGFVVGTVLYVGFAVLYEWITVAVWGASLGKMAVGIQVVDEHTGTTIGWGRSFVRHLVVIGPMLLPYLGVLASLAVLLSVFFDNTGRMQGWHDKAAHDLVVKKPRPPVTNQMYRR